MVDGDSNSARLLLAMERLAVRRTVVANATADFEIRFNESSAVSGWIGSVSDESPEAL